MNYKSQLKGWAVDRIIELWKVHKPSPVDLATLKQQSDELAAYAYVPREDLESTAKDLFELVRNAPAGQSSVDALIGTLEHIREDRIRQQIDVMPGEPVAAQPVLIPIKTAKGSH